MATTRETQKPRLPELLGANYFLGGAAACLY
jgi:hypothetical protein